jgi:hypothetical protein
LRSNFPNPQISKQEIKEDKMRKLIVAEFITLDGVIQAPGGGKRLFPEGTRLNLKLVEAAPLPTGVVYMRYRRA